MGRTNLGIYGRRWLEEGGGKDKHWNLRKEVARRRRRWEGQTLESTEGGSSSSVSLSLLSDEGGVGDLRCDVCCDEVFRPRVGGRPRPRFGRLTSL